MENTFIGGENPADLQTREVTAMEFKASKLWCYGHRWLQQSLSEWPKFADAIEAEDSKDELRVGVKRSQQGVWKAINTVTS